MAALFTHSFGRLLGRRQAYWFTLAGIALYVLLVGADPVVTRAGVMGSLYVTALYLGRRATAYVSLAAATMLLTLINPLTLWNVGFQLSAAATLGLILFTPPIEEALERCLTRIASEETSRTIVRLLSTVLVVTLAAQILTMPLVIHYFGRLSLVSPLSNFLILPVQPHIMGWGAVATVAGLVPQLELAARGVAMVPWLCLAFTNAIVRWMATWPFASIEMGNVHPGWLAAYYGLLFGGLWVARQGAEDARRLRDGAMRVLPSKAVVGVLLVALVIALLAVLQLPDGRLRVAFLDVGQGDAILITLPRGQQILVDGGPNPVALASALGREMPFWDRSIDLVVLTHADADHVSGLPEVLKRFEVDNWLDNGLDSDNAAYLRCQELLEEAGTSRHSVRSGDRLDLVEGIVVEVLHPSSEMIGGDGESDTNNNSVVLRLDWAQVSFLLTGDLEAKGEGYLLRSDRHLLADVLKVSHHGSAASSTDDFLAAVAPSYAVISVSEENNFGHPSPSVLDRLDQRQDLEVLRTDEQGAVEFTTDGHRLWIRTDR